MSNNKTFIVSAPGRVNLIGEHTDYNGGFVLPSAIPQRTEVQITPRDDMRVVGQSSNFTGADAHFEYLLGEETPSKKWWDYIQGVTSALRKEATIPSSAQKMIRGFDLKISSTVPLGSGLSSSAALEVALLRGIRKAFLRDPSLDLSDILIAKLGQKAENDFVGARVGVMDQMAASLADQGSALFLDTRSFEYRKVLLPKNSELVVINSGIEHSHAGGDYNTRRAECEAACTELGIKELRDLSVDDLQSARFLALPALLQKRAKHVVTENQRVLDSVKAMESDEPEKLGALFKESHLSMKDDYAVSIPEIDQMVQIACRQSTVYGARLTGGGFGGSIVVLCKKGRAREVSRSIATHYRSETGQTPSILVPGVQI